MIRRPPRSTQSRSSAASDVYKRQVETHVGNILAKLNVASRAEAVAWMWKHGVVWQTDDPDGRISQSW